jgi:3-hydroxymyristoyl/3-hydroxydecanoyl-(acyl carrier protein) dehydratase
VTAGFVVRARRVEGEVVTAAVHVPAGLPYFDGHFDGAPVLPAVAQLEAIVLPLCREAWGELGAPRRWLRLKFRRPIGPDSELEVRLARRGGGAVVEFTLALGGAVATSGAADFAEPPP